MRNKIGCFIIVMLCGMAVNAQDWLTDMEVSKQAVAESDKAILIVFQGSDWCAPCIKMKKEIWSSETFQDFAKEKLVLLEADFPRRKKNQLPEAQQAHNAQLAEKYNPQGYFPYAILINGEEELLGSFGYETNKSPGDYINQIETLIQ